MRRKKLGFTLAEVLIVIGIIGVVAALTLPNLNHATGDKEKVTKVKKIYSTLTEAVDRAQVIYGSCDTWANGLSTDAEINERFAKRVTEFMKVSKDCGFGEGCFSSAPLLLSDGEELESNCLENFQYRNNYMVTLSDGMSVAFDEAGRIIRVDIDGPNKGKNQEGVDIFDFRLFFTENESTSFGVNINQLYPSSAPSYWQGNLDEPPFAYETAWVIENGNLDYLKCLEELNWETKASCE